MLTVTPGFSGPGSCLCCSSMLRLKPPIVPRSASSYFMDLWTVAWICCPQLPYPPAKTGSTTQVKLLWERKKEKTHKHNFLGLSRDFGGDFVYVFFSPIRNDPKKTHKQIFGTHPVPGQSRKVVYVYVCFLSLLFL